MDLIEIIARLGAATFVGAIIGLNRDLHNKPTGVRTLGLVALGAALVVVAGQATIGADLAVSSRIAQGVITGIGFLGAGVIFRSPTEPKVHGMTTAASIWLTAGLGLACGFGVWRVVIVSVVLVGVLLIYGGRFEKRMHELLTGEKLPPDHVPPHQEL